MKKRIVPFYLITLFISLHSCKTELDLQPEGNSLNASLDNQELFASSIDKDLPAAAKISYDIGKELAHLASQD